MITKDAQTRMDHVKRFPVRTMWDAEAKVNTLSVKI